ncbi:flagellar hook-basal body complex protein [Zymomonas mobilis]|uniref:flagellar hook-basal body complex protein n=1 Tax=Zymomonas mobilis TaxID=542 RepID=UPI0003C77647|nr:flagellar hook-basal body complex protein [Zymomonas mobilis]AHB09982.1 flagellar hook-basal body protein [Zymomonas mobilis subsp. mobilis str. CP4 = NRRL B-14023]AHJ70287.1 Flagellar hook protein flgE [Zymomonas mobilis subsp. mobilis NRRL B-12526]AHJ72142.1 Flagellar hook protein flgE [Zymomonas mobilis subsp. mobilis str. CP4 = NRRL B-14023]MCP9307283.1 flagellar hook-basal body complex protein [Zymomonas mobilis]TWE25763.1 flagellar hook protein FlgE [Zymomonas mobilis]
MAFYTSLTGLNAAQTDLSVTSNNIANSGSYGFKKTTTDFGELVADSPLASGQNIGQGTRLRATIQDFTSGSMKTTNRALDMMVNGDGFFLVKSPGASGTVSLTRDGSFLTDKNNNVVTSDGHYLQVYATTNSGNIYTSTDQTSATGGRIVKNLTLPSYEDQVSISSNTGDTVQVGNSLAATGDVTVNIGGTATTITGAKITLGGATIGTDGTTATGGVLTITGGTVNGAANTATYTSTGATATVTTTAGTSTLTNITGLGTLSYNGENYTGATIANVASATTDESGDTSSALSNISVGTDGKVTATFANGNQYILGAVALGDVNNRNGLHSTGNANWTVTGTSGSLNYREADTSGLGSVQSGALELSNIDLTQELVNLISEQRNFQANSKAISTDNQMVSYVMNIQS